MDEIEAHLHPRWQRTILGALLQAMDVLTGEKNVPVQLLAVTHSPMVLASPEPFFDPSRDRIWDLNQDSGSVVLEQKAFIASKDRDL